MLIEASYGNFVMRLNVLPAQVTIYLSETHAACFAPGFYQGRFERLYQLFGAFATKMDAQACSSLFRIQKGVRSILHAIGVSCIELVMAQTPKALLCLHTVNALEQVLPT